MGYPYASLKKIIEDRALFHSKHVLTLGTLYPFVSRGETRRLEARGLNMKASKEAFSKYLFVEYLGARSCQSLDVSNYQRSDIICNLNYTIPADYVEKYDVVVDMGTLEHLANLSTALRNIFGLLKMSGIYYFGVPCNNWVNHGFFQFSPTFFLDLCTDNPGLDLLELDLRTESKLYNYASLNPAFIQALLCSQRKLAVGGVIQKKQSGIDLNLTQSKYRYLHTLGRADGGSRHLVDYPPARQVTLSLARRVLGKALDVFCRTSLVPLVVKELVISRLYRLPRAISEERIKGRIHL